MDYSLCHQHKGRIPCWNPAFFAPHGKGRHSERSGTGQMKKSGSSLSFSNFFTIFAIGKEPNQTQGIMVKVLRYLDPRADLTFKKIFGEHA
ncbi:MAG: hypothetical protein SO365_00135, partial [Prevotella sp.]|nr:hypothetical protein [Prevotella sp.]